MKAATTADIGYQVRVRSVNEGYNRSHYLVTEESLHNLVTKRNLFTL
jgi:hypothetical protein